MLSRWRREETLILFVLFVLGVATVAAAVLLSDTLARDMLRRDAETLATHWARHIAAHLADPAAVEPAPDHSHELYTAQGLRLLAEAPARPAPAGMSLAGAAPGGLRTFHSGRHVGYVHRYAVFAADGALIARSGRFAPQELDAMPASAAGFIDSVARRAPALTYVDTDRVGQPAHLARVFVPLEENGRVAKVVLVEADQSASFTLLSSALGMVIFAAATVMVTGIGVALLFVWRRIRVQFGMSERIRFLAMHDTLTNLPNRREFTRVLADALARSAREGGAVAVLCLDVDRFRQINDALGHHTGDQLLKHVAEAIRDALPAFGATAARLGADEFGILLRGREARVQLRALADDVRRRISRPLCGEHGELVTSVAVGIAIGPADGADPMTLLKHADMALYQAKQGGLDASRFYAPEMERAALARREMEHDLRRALARDELYLVYQPQVDIRTGTITGYEALLRWDHPEKGTIEPADFIPHAEEAGLIMALGEWALRAGCRYAATWPEPLLVAINLSATQIMGGDVVRRVADILAETGLDPGRLELEITESVLLHNVERVRAALRGLDALGVSMALDDFGTGYSSLSYLARFRFSKIKIDRSFVGALAVGRETVAVVRSIIGLGRTLGMTTLAEGVETAEQLRILRAAGCSEVQGFLFGHPGRAILEPWERTVRMARVMRQEYALPAPADASPAGGDEAPAASQVSA